MMHNLTYNVVTKRLANAIAAGTGDTLTQTAVDTQGYAGVRFIILLGAVSATATMTGKLQQSSDNGSTDTYDDIAGSSCSFDADTDDNKILITDIFKPKKRYLKLILARATANIAIDGIIVELYLPSAAPVTQDATVEKAVVLAYPNEGTP
jgi:hypothetical protein